MAMNALAMVMAWSESDARAHLSTIEGNRGKAPEYKGKLESLVGNVQCFAPLQDWRLVKEQLKEECKGEDNPIPEQRFDKPGLHEK